MQTFQKYPLPNFSASKYTQLLITPYPSHLAVSCFLAIDYVPLCSFVYLFILTYSRLSSGLISYRKTSDSLPMVRCLTCVHYSTQCILLTQILSHFIAIVCSCVVCPSSLNCMILERRNQHCLYQPHFSVPSTQQVSHSRYHLAHSSTTQVHHLGNTAHHWFCVHYMEDLKSTPGQFLEPGSSLNPMIDSSLISITLVSEDIFLSLPPLLSTKFRKYILGVYLPRHQTRNMTQN